MYSQRMTIGPRMAGIGEDWICAEMERLGMDTCKVKTGSGGMGLGMMDEKCGDGY